MHSQRLRLFCLQLIPDVRRHWTRIESVYPEAPKSNIQHNFKAPALTGSFVDSESRKFWLQDLRTLAASIGMFVVPVVSWHFYLSYSRTHWVRGYPDFLVAGVAIAVGIGCIWLFPARKGIKALVSLAYAPLAFGVLAVYGLFYVCSLGSCF